MRDSALTADSKVYVNRSHCSTNETVSRVYLEQDTIKNASNSNYISPKPIYMDGLHLITELYIFITLSIFTKTRESRFLKIQRRNVF